jgi:hypothetical protein
MGLKAVLHLVKSDFSCIRAEARFSIAFNAAMKGRSSTRPDYTIRNLTPSWMVVQHNLRADGQSTNPGYVLLRK